MAVALHYFTEFGTLGANYIKVLEVKPILSAYKIQPKESIFQQYMIYANN